MISKLPRQQLLGQHRECCALRGNGWGKKHATVDYVFHYSPYRLFQYHQLVMDEMEKRGYSPAPEWKILCIVANHAKHFDLPTVERNVPIYPEHDEVYLAECLANLEQKEFIT